MYRTYALAVLAAVNLIGCASVPMGDPKQDTALKSFSAKPDVAGVYIYRNETIGAAVHMDVALDGKPIGQTAAKTYFYKELAPGKHTVTSKAENTDTLELEAEAGNLYYVWQEVKMGVLFARTKLHLVGETEGKKGVRETSLALSATSSGPAAPSSSTDIQDVENLSKFGAKVKNSYGIFLARPLPRAFAITEDGRSWTAWGTKPKNPNSAIEPSLRAVPDCEAYHHTKCTLYAVDNYVVY